jgi:sulfur carrier protein
MTRVNVNGTPRDLPDGATVQRLLEELDVEVPSRGIAVAVNAGVVPSSEWSTYEVPEGARVEIVTAIQGGC